MIKLTIGTNVHRSTIIVDPSKTVREIADENHLNYSNDLYFNCERLSEDQMDCSLQSIGLQDSGNSLLRIPNKNGGATLNVYLDMRQVKLVSTRSPEEYQLIKSFYPNMLVQTDFNAIDEFHEDWRIDIGDGKFNEYSVSFAPTPNRNGKAYAIAEIPESLTNEEEILNWIEKNFSSILNVVSNLEMSTCFESAVETKNKVKEMIKVVED